MLQASQTLKKIVWLMKINEYLIFSEAQILQFLWCNSMLVLGHVTDHRTPIYAAPVAPSFLESTPLHTNTEPLGV